METMVTTLSMIGAQLRHEDTYRQIVAEHEARMVHDPAYRARHLANVAERYAARFGEAER